MGTLPYTGMYAQYISTTHTIGTHKIKIGLKINTNEVYILKMF